MSENLYVVEVVEFKTNKVVSTVGVPGMPKRRTEQVERGMNINLDHGGLGPERGCRRWRRP